MNSVQKFEQEQASRLTENKKIPDFKAGDTVRVDVKIIEGTNERIQAFEGVCIARKNRGVHSSFTVRKISHGEGVERVFSLYSPLVESIKVIRRGDVRRAKLYYMRGLTGKAARIKEKRDLLGVSKEEAQEVAVAADVPLPEPEESISEDVKESKEAASQESKQASKKDSKEEQVSAKKEDTAESKQEAKESDSTKEAVSEEKKVEASDAGATEESAEEAKKEENKDK